MLKKIYIKNFATIDYLEIDFCGRLNVLSGETGAGKSIIIESVNFLLGRTKGTDVIRTGEKEGFVSAVFGVSGEEGKAELPAILADIGIDRTLNLKNKRQYSSKYVNDEEDIILKRTINDAGKSKYFINNEQVNKNIPEKISEYLVKIFGQNDRRFLLDPNSQLVFLDDFAENKDLLILAKNLYGDIKKIEAERQSITKRIDKARRIKTINSYIINDVEKLEIKSENDAEILKEELKRLENINSIKEYVLSSIDLIDNEELGLLKNLSPLISNLSKLSELDSNFKQKEDLRNAETAKILLEDLLLSLEKHSSFEQDEDRLNEVRFKLDSIIGTLNKYGVSNLKELLNMDIQAKKEINDISGLEERFASIESDFNNLKEKFIETSHDLHSRRTAAAHMLEKEIEKELLFLGIKPLFKIELSAQDFDEGFSETGLSGCIFMFSANPGEDPKPLSKVVSGGELSRISLCMLKILNKKKDTAAFIFDEIDAGIGGDVANFVGEALKAISKNNQVILITHLAQVSSFADEHFLVYKEVVQEKTYTRIKNLLPEERIKETARMLSGDSKSEPAIMHAKEILKRRGFFV